MKKRRIFCLVLTFMVTFLAGVVGVHTYGARSVDFENSITVENKTDGVFIQWDALTEAQGYHIYRTDGTVRENIGTVAKNRKTAYTDETVQGGKEYSYSVCAFDNEKELSETQTINILRLETPEMLSAKNGVGGVDLSWKQIDGAEKYIIYRDLKGKNEIVAELTPDNPCSFKDTTAVSGSKYKYAVVAFADTYKSSYKYTKAITFVSAPEEIKAVNNNGSVSVSWDSVGNADRYLLYRKTNGSKWSYLGSFDSKTTGYTDKNISNGNVYTYTVKVLSGKIYSGYDSFGVSTNYVDVPAVKFITNKNDCLEITWTPVDKASQYRIYKKSEMDTVWQFAGESTSTSFTDEEVGDGIMYCYTVRAVGDNGGVSSYLPGRYMTVLKMPDIWLNCTTEGVMINWSKMPLASGYRIYKKANNAANWTLISTISSNSKCYLLDKQVKNANDYTYTVRQVYSGVYGSFNEGVKTKFYPAPTVTARLSPKGLLVNWNKANSGTGYIIDRMTENNKVWQQIAKVDGIGNVSYADGKAAYGYVNYYRVRVNGANMVSNTVSIYGIDPNKPAVALTYDDGPHNTVTHDVLDVLEKYDAKATFFVVGSRVAYYPDCLKRASELGCEIGNHTYNHKILTSATNSEIASEISRTNNAVKNVTGKAPEIMRAPGGAYNSRVKSEVGMPLIQWSVDTLDWKNRNASSVIASVKRNTRDGSIILMHDLYGSTAEATETIVPWLVSEGYQLVTVSELMQLKGIDMNDGGVYFSGS